MSVKELLALFSQGERQTLRARMIRGAGASFFFKITNTCLVIITTLILARLLGAEEYGVFAYAISWASLLSVPAAMGLGILLIREIANYNAREEWEALKGILHWSDRVSVVSSLGLAAIFCMAVWFLHDRFEPRVRVALWMATSLLPFLVFMSLRQGSLQGFGRVVEAQIPLMLVYPGLFFCFVIICYLVFGLSASLAIGLLVFAALIAFVVGTGLLARCLPPSAKKIRPGYHSRQWLRSTLPLLFIGTAGIVNQQISTVIVGSLLGVEAAGLFDVAGKGATLVSFVLLAVNMPLAPVVADLYVRGEIKRLQRMVTKSTRAAFLGSLPIALGLIFFGHWVLLIFGREFARGSIAIAILSAGQLVNVGMGSVALLLNMTGHEWDTAKGIGIAALLSLTLNLALVPIWGMEGAAIASAVSMAAWNVLLAWWVYKRLGIHSSVIVLGSLRDPV
jgi:O-antigen/teichoic acid export membrane protein